MYLTNGRTGLAVFMVGLLVVVPGCGRVPAARTITVGSLLAEMVDFENLALRPGSLFGLDYIFLIRQ